MSLAEAELNRQRVELLAERDRLLARNAELEQERDAAIARTECDGSFERQGKESHKAAIAALWNADPKVAYESPAQVIGWLQAQLAKAQWERERLHVRSACATQLAMDLRERADILARAIDPMSETPAAQRSVELLVECAESLRKELANAKAELDRIATDKAYLARAGLANEWEERYEMLDGANRELSSEIKRLEAQCAAPRKALQAVMPFVGADPEFSAGEYDRYNAALNSAKAALQSDAGAKLLADHAAELDRLRGVDLANRALCEWQKEARAALKRYGRHTEDCDLTLYEPSGDSTPLLCTCGLVAIYTR